MYIVTRWATLTYEIVGLKAAQLLTYICEWFVSACKPEVVADTRCFAAPQDEQSWKLSAKMCICRISDLYFERSAAECTRLVCLECAPTSPALLQSQ